MNRACGWVCRTDLLRVSGVNEVVQRARRSLMLAWQLCDKCSFSSSASGTSTLKTAKALRKLKLKAPPSSTSSAESITSASPPKTSLPATSTRASTLSPRRPHRTVSQLSSTPYKPQPIQAAPTSATHVPILSRPPYRPPSAGLFSPPPDMPIITATRKVDPPLTRKRSISPPDLESMRADDLTTQVEGSGTPRDGAVSRGGAMLNKYSSNLPPDDDRRKSGSNQAHLCFYVLMALAAVPPFGLTVVHSKWLCQDPLDDEEEAVHEKREKRMSWIQLVFGDANDVEILQAKVIRMHLCYAQILTLALTFHEIGLYAGGYMMKLQDFYGPFVKIRAAAHFFGIAYTVFGASESLRELTSPTYPIFTQSEHKQPRGSGISNLFRNGSDAQLSLDSRDHGIYASLGASCEDDPLSHHYGVPYSSQPWHESEPPPHSAIDR
eukprot:GHVN01061955.1.p1 GENE.GHVN01061955.1~~GHVN01061955.1.p1  ORF type:complete len:437 (-),score=66.35 GHVN01061955.1:113-1423(-)